MNTAGKDRPPGVMEGTIVMQDEAQYLCYNCGEEIVIPVDLSQGASQNFIEDCPVCCHPNYITVEIAHEGVARAWSRSP